MAIIKSLLTDGQDGIGPALVLNCIWALLFTVLFAPLLLCLYLLVRADGGPAFVGYEQVRGNGTALRCWRFRTVKWHGRDRRPPAHDAPVTAVGRFLLKTRSDTLPLLYNVAKGELTLSEMLNDA